MSDGERDQLERWARCRRSSQALALRCRIVLACAEGLSNKEVAERVGVSLPTVGKWRGRFLESRLDGLPVFCFNVCSTGSAVFFRSVG